MSYMTGKTQRVRITMMRLRYAKAINTFFNITAELLAFLTGRRPKNYEPPFGDGGSAVLAFA